MPRRRRNQPPPVEAQDVLVPSCWHERMLARKRGPSRRHQTHRECPPPPAWPASLIKAAPRALASQIVLAPWHGSRHTLSKRCRNRGGASDTNRICPTTDAHTTYGYGWRLQPCRHPHPHAPRAHTTHTCTHTPEHPHTHTHIYSYQAGQQSAALHPGQANSWAHGPLQQQLVSGPTLRWLVLAHRELVCSAVQSATRGEEGALGGILGQHCAGNQTPLLAASACAPPRGGRHRHEDGRRVAW